MHSLHSPCHTLPPCFTESIAFWPEVKKKKKDASNVRHSSVNVCGMKKKIHQILQDGVTPHHETAHLVMFPLLIGHSCYSNSMQKCKWDAFFFSLLNLKTFPGLLRIFPGSVMKWNGVFLADIFLVFSIGLCDNADLTWPLFIWWRGSKNKYGYKL